MSHQTEIWYAAYIYALCRSVVEFHINQMGDDILRISNFIELANSIDPNIQQHKIHLMIEVQVAL